MANVEQSPSVIKAVQAATLSSGPQPPSATSDEPMVKRFRSELGSPEMGSVKYFVGQIPREYDEDRLKTIFEEFGPVHQVHMIKDKVTNMSKGCCFLQFMQREDGQKAQKALHNKITLPGMANPMQMQPADSERRNLEDRKVFVGMLSKKQTEQDVITMFSPYGDIDECVVLKDRAGQSKGCAFVTFATKWAAQNAIRSMHESSRMEGCTSTIKVRLADNARDKEDRRVREGGSRWGPMAPGFGGGNTAPPMATGPSSFGQTPQFSAPSMQPSLLQQQQQAPNANTNAAGSALVTLITGLVQAASGGQPNPQLEAVSSLLTAAMSNPQTNGAAQPSFQQPTPAVNPSFNGSAFGAGASSFGSNGSSGFGASSGFSAAPSKPLPSGTDFIAGGKREGPDGANLFVYHLPQEFTDNDLGRTFAAFGKVISTKVFIDQKTNQSKCFGFVSYDNAQSAQKAISEMNGFQIGARKLRVQIKKPRD